MPVSLAVGECLLLTLRPRQMSHMMLPTYPAHCFSVVFSQSTARRIVAYSGVKRTRDQIGFGIYRECLGLKAKSEFSFLMRNLMVAPSSQI